MSQEGSDEDDSIETVKGAAAVICVVGAETVRNVFQFLPLLKLSGFEDFVDTVYLLASDGAPSGMPDRSSERA